MMVSSHPEGPAALNAFAANDPYFGAKVVYNIKGKVSESHLRALYIATAGDNWALPVMANGVITNPDSLSNEKGVSLGAFPWYSVLHTGGMQVLLHGGLSYHLLNITESSSLTQVRLLGGVQVVVYAKEDKSPIVVSVAPEYIIEPEIDKSSLGLSMAGVMPIANGLGVLFEGVLPLDGKKVKEGFKIGVVANGIIKSNRR